MPSRLILFDIDGTLMSTDGVCISAFTEALIEVFGTAGPVESYAFAGRTDPGIVADLMLAAGFDPARVEDDTGWVLDRYLDRLENRLDPARVCLKPGIVELLEALAERPDLSVGLLTGNHRRGARIKIERAGLEGFFGFGAYGSDDADRDKLVPVARRRAERVHGRGFLGSQCVVVGDAVADVRCARADGARAVAVATGLTDRSELELAAADALLDDLSDLDAGLVALGLD